MRPSASITKADLLLLGMLLDRPMHGYELHQTMQEEGINAWFNLSMAGVYYSLGKLRDKGLVAEAQQRSATGGARSTYRLTEAGRRAFFQGMEAAVGSEEKVQFDYNVGIYLLNRLPVDRALALLEERRHFLGQWGEEVTQALEGEAAGRGPLHRAILDHTLRFLEMEKAWLDDVIQGVRGGQYPGEGRAGAHQGLMLLSGDLRQFHLPDLVRLIASGHHSGTLTVTDGRHTRSIGFEDGRPRCAWCEQLGASPSPGEVLESICDLFRWQEGTFQLDQSTACGDWCVPLDLSAQELILLGCRWVDNWGAIQRLVPSTETIFEAREGVPDELSAHLLPAERRVLEAVDGTRGVEALARDLGLTIFEASKMLYCLVAAGLIVTAEESKIRLRRVFREVAELLCRSTYAWRTSPGDRSCEEEVNQGVKDLPLRLQDGHVEDQTSPATSVEELERLYRRFVQMQLKVITRRFGPEKARASYQEVLQHLSPELRQVAARHRLDSLSV